ncbi:MAG: DUF58 domain-containing protein [Butyrivibrio sp.]|nr:DUF58 domain-containing protein [Butyrivibrio sp.]
MKIVVDKKGLLVYLLILVLSVLFASFYGGPVSFVWLHAILLIFPISVLYIFLSHYFLSLYQEIEVHKLSKKDRHDYRLILENNGILPIHGMTLGLYSDRCDLDEIKESDVIALGVHERREIASSIRCRYAGAYDAGVRYLKFTDPFRILCIWFEVSYSFRALVSPRITDIAERSLDIENIVNSTGLKSMHLFEDSSGSDLRNYLPGDQMSKINWKVSARFSELMTRLPDRMEKKTVNIILQAVNVPEHDQDLELLKKRDYFLEFAVSAAWHFGEQGVPVSLIYPAGEIKEALVDSHDTFLEFFNEVTNGLFYRSEEEFKKLNEMTDFERNGRNASDTWILIREDREPGEGYCCII